MSPPTLAAYPTTRETTVSADASGYGVGVMLLQVHEDGERRPVCFASRSLTDTEKRYAVIEKVALASSWACEKYAVYVTGTNFVLETDHKPLVPLLGSTDIAKLHLRILRVRLMLMRYSPELRYIQCRQQTTADALSRAPVERPSTGDTSFVEEVDVFADLTVQMLPASEVKRR